VSPLVVVTHNIAQALPLPLAEEALDAVLAQRPDVVGLQECYPRRWQLLRAKGAFAWSHPLVGGCVVGVSRERFAGLSARGHRLSWPGRADRGEAPLGFEPPRVCVVVRCEERLTGVRFALVGFHLVHGVQLSGEYRRDRPRLVARHQGEVARLSQLVQRLEDEGRLVVAMGDSNFTGLSLPGLTSAWTGRHTAPGTLGRRRVDDVHAPAAPTSVVTIGTPSDHRAVVAAYADVGAWAR
jgi:hypothetical protein